MRGYLSGSHHSTYFKPSWCNYFLSDLGGSLELNSFLSPVYYCLSISLCNNILVECGDWGCNLKVTNHLVCFLVFRIITFSLKRNAEIHSKLLASYPGCYPCSSSPIVRNFSPGLSRKLSDMPENCCVSTSQRRRHTILVSCFTLAARKLTFRFQNAQSQQLLDGKRSTEKYKNRN